MDCTASHTTVTYRIVTFDQAPDWGDSSLWRRIATPCVRGLFSYFDGKVNQVHRSAFTFYWFVPTKAERDAGAKWVRCDLALAGGTRLQPLPTDGSPELGSLPLPKDVAKCRMGKAKQYITTVCAQSHAFRATHSLRYPRSTYPGSNKMRQWTIRKCRARLNTAFYYEYPATRLQWKAGERYSVCLKKTST